jgi:glycosyltransferase involved in cell wall biosynthesis
MTAAQAHGSRSWQTGMHIGFSAPLATDDIRHLLDDPEQPLPAGYAGAPLSATLIEGLLAKGHTVTAFTLSRDMAGTSSQPVRARGTRLTVVYCPMRARAWRPNGWRPGRILDLHARERHALRTAIEAARPDVVHAHWAYEFAWAALSSGVPHVITSHDSPFTIARYYKGFTLGGYRWLRAGMAWHVLRHAKMVSTVSPYMVGEIQSLCRAAVQVVPNPVAEDVFGIPRQDEVGHRRVLMVCNGWDARKNPQPALRAFADMSARIPEVELVMLGAGFGPGQEAQGWWAEQGLRGRAQFVGAVPHRQVLQWMARSELLLHPSLEESFGAVVAEAMAIGLPVVAGHASGAVPWVVGDAGCLVDVRSASAIADALFGLLDDSARRTSLGEKARAAVRRRFSAADVIDQYLRLYALAMDTQETAA